MRFAFVTLALACLAAATPARRTDVLQCNDGSVTCCNRTEDSKALSPATVKTLGSLGIVISAVVAAADLVCIGATSCSQSTVCCTNNNFNGVVALGCSPVSINV